MVKPSDRIVPLRSHATAAASKTSHSGFAAQWDSTQIEVFSVRSRCGWFLTQSPSDSLNSATLMVSKCGGVDESLNDGTLSHAYSDFATGFMVSGSRNGTSVNGPFTKSVSLTG